MLPRQEASPHKTICRRKGKYCSPLHFTIKTDFNASATGAITCLEILRICQANRGFFRLTGSSSEVQQKTQGSYVSSVNKPAVQSSDHFYGLKTRKQRRKHEINLYSRVGYRTDRWMTTVLKRTAEE